MNENRVKVLIIDGDSGFLEEVKTELADYFTVYNSLTGGEGLKVFAQLRPQVVMVDCRSNRYSLSRSGGGFEGTGWNGAADCDFV